MTDLNSLRCTTAKEVVEAVIKAMNISGKLTAFGVVVDDAMLISAVIRSLPKRQYTTFLDSWLMFDIEQQTLQRFVAKLLEKSNVRDGASCSTRFLWYDQP